MKGYGKNEMLAAGALMASTRQADSDAFMDALDPLLPDAYRLAYALLRDRDEAGDIVQEATLRAWRHRRSFRADSPMRPWFLAIVANQCRRAAANRWRSVLKRADMTVSQGGDPTSADEAESLRHALQQLNERDRVLVVLRYYLDLSFDEVAATLRISPGAARVRAHRAIERLRSVVNIEQESIDG
jgi:RNA polymerase sigma factor (sigma-70 family)